MAPERTILIVDDAAMFRELESLFLARSGRVTTAADGEEALALARTLRPDVVVTDLVMPNVDGETLCRAIKSDPDLKATPVILVIPGEDAQDHARAVRAGADDIIAKPIDRISLIQAVNRFLHATSVRGLTRIELEAPVRIQMASEDAWGTARNLSRGGMFIETESHLQLETEVRIEFELPEIADPLSSTAQVVWHRDPAPGQPQGMGLQFLAQDRRCVKSIEQFVYERAPRVRRPPSAERRASAP